jgi:hypothetical protein
MTTMAEHAKTPLKIQVRDVHEFDASGAAHDLIRMGMVAVDDIGEGLHDVAWEELHEELGHGADGLNLKKQRVDTGWGPVFVMRDADRVTAAAARKAVLQERPPLKKTT